MGEDLMPTTGVGVLKAVVVGIGAMSVVCGAA